MRLNLMAILGLLLSFSLHAQKTEKVLLTRMHDDGMLYHLKSLELDACKKSTLSIDFTYLPTDKEDSARILIALTHPSLKGTPQKITFSFKEQLVGFAGDAFKVLYVEKDKKDWVTRIELSMEETAFLELLANGDFSLNLTFAEGECIGSSTKKAAQVYQETRTIIEYN